MMLSTEPPEKYGMMTQRFWTAPKPRQTWRRALWSREAAHRAVNEGAVARHQVRVVEQAHGLRLFANLLLHSGRRVSFARRGEILASCADCSASGAGRRCGDTRQAVTASQPPASAVGCQSFRAALGLTTARNARTSLPGSCRSRSRTLMAKISPVGLHSARHTCAVGPAERPRQARCLWCNPMQRPTDLGANALADFFQKLVVRVLGRHHLGHARPAQRRAAA